MLDELPETFNNRSVVKPYSRGRKLDLKAVTTNMASYTCKLGLSLCLFVASLRATHAQIFLECGSLEGCNGCVCPAEPLGCYDFVNNPGVFNAAFEGTITTNQCINYTWSATVDSFLGGQGFFNLDVFSTADGSFNLFFSNNDGRGNKGWGIRYAGNYWYQSPNFGDQSLTGPSDLGAKNQLHTVCLVLDGINFDVELDGTRLGLNSGGPLSGGPPIMSNIPFEQYNASLAFITFNVNFGNGQCLDDFNMTLFLNDPPTPAPTAAPTELPTAAPTPLPVGPTHPFLECGSLEGCNGCVCPADPVGCYDFVNNPGDYNAAFEGAITTDQCFNYTWDAPFNSFLGAQGFFSLDFFATADGVFNLFFGNNDGRANKGWGLRYAGNYWFQTAGFGDQTLTGPTDLGAKNQLHTVCLVLNGLNFDLELDGVALGLNSGGPLSGGPPITSDILLERYNVSLSFMTFNVNFGTGQCLDDFNMTLFLNEPPTAAPTAEPTYLPTTAPTPIPSASPTQLPVGPTHPYLECGSLEGCSGCVCPAKPLGCYDFVNNPGDYNAAFEGSITTDQCFRYTWDAGVDSFLASQGFFNLDFFATADGVFNMFFSNNDGRGNKGWGIRYAGNYWYQTGTFGNQQLTGSADLGAKSELHTVCLVLDGLNFDLELDGVALGLTSGGPLSGGPPITSDIPLERYNVSLSFLTFNVNFGTGQCLDDFNMTLFLEQATPSPTSNAGFEGFSLLTIGSALVVQMMARMLNSD